MDKVEIKVRHNGPYKVTGPIRLIDADGNEYDLGADDEPIVLCRCGDPRRSPSATAPTSRTASGGLSERRRRG